MRSARLFPLLPLLFAACSTAFDWNEVQTAPMTLAQCYKGLEDVASTGNSGLAPDIPNCDRGLGTWQSRWLVVQRRPWGLGRYRLRAEILLDEGSSATGWIIRYVFERQKVVDPRHEYAPSVPDDQWDDDGQDRVAEELFGQRLQLRVGAGT